MKDNHRLPWSSSLLLLFFPLVLLLNPWSNALTVAMHPTRIAWQHTTRCPRLEPLAVKITRSGLLVAAVFAGGQMAYLLMQLRFMGTLKLWSTTAAWAVVTAQQPPTTPDRLMKWTADACALEIQKRSHATVLLDTRGHQLAKKLFIQADRLLNVLIQYNDLDARI